MCGMVGNPAERPVYVAMTVTVETPGYWRCQDCEIPTKKTCRSGVESLRLREQWCVLRVADLEKWGFLGPLETIIIDRCWTLEL